MMVYRLNIFFSMSSAQVVTISPVIRSVGFANILGRGTCIIT